MTQLHRTTKILLYTTVFLIPFYFIRFKIFGLPTNIFEVAVGLTFFFYLIYKIWEIGIWELFRSIRSIRAINLLSPLLIVATFVGAWKAGFTHEALGIFKGWFLIPILLYWSVVNVTSKNQIKLLAWPIYSSLMTVSLWAVLQKFGLITTLFYQKGDSTFGQYLAGNFRVFGPFESPNYLAMSLVPMIFLSLLIFDFRNSHKYSSTMQLQGRSKEQNSSLPTGKAGCRQHIGSNNIILGLFYLLPLAALIYSGSRAGIIAFVASIIIYLLISKKSSVGSKVLYYALVMTLLVAGTLVLLEFGFDPANDNIRLEIYRYSVELLRSNWLCGLGLGEFQNKLALITTNTESFKTFALPYAIHPHNLYLAVWLNLGLSGIIIFLGILVTFIINLFKSNHGIVKSALFMAMMAILIHGLFDTTYFKNDLSAIFWLIVAISIINRD